jgi:hypothetical protein
LIQIEESKVLKRKSFLIFKWSSLIFVIYNLCRLLSVMVGLRLKKK